MIHPLHHPDVHRPASEWSEGETLHVAACYGNPFRWRTRRELANDFRRHMMQTPNVKLYLGELAYGDRPFDVTDKTLYPTDVQLRTRFELFHKENLLNAIIRTFPPGWKYGAIVDADFHFSRHDWALEAVHQLQHYDWVQLFSSYTNLSGETLGTGHRITSAADGFAYTYVQNGNRLPEGWSKADCATSGTAKPKTWVGAPGGAWAFRREAFDAVGGLLDRCILGSGDWFMAFGLIGEEAPDRNMGAYTADYQEHIHAWTERAARLKGNIGYVDGHALHHFHGPMNLRGYGTRDDILIDNKFSPTFDVYPDWQGILQLTPTKPRLRDEIRRYFLSRCEDLPHRP